MRDLQDVNKFCGLSNKMEFIFARNVRDRLKADQQKRDTLAQMMDADAAFTTAQINVNTHFKNLTIDDNPTLAVPVSSIGPQVTRFVNQFKTQGYYVQNDGTNVTIMLYDPNA